MRSSSVHINRSNSAGKAKVFIGGLSRSSTDDSLKMYFQQFGEVIAAEVLRDHHTMCSRGFGFITFAQEEVANRIIITGLNKPHIVDGKKVEVKMAIPKDEVIGSTSQARVKDKKKQPRKSYPGYTKGSYSSPNFRECSSQNYSRRNSSPSWPDKLIKSGSTLSSSSESTAFTLPRDASFAEENYVLPEPEVVANKIFVGGLQYSTGHDRLRRYFMRYGSIHSAEVIYNRDTKKSRGFGFVVFDHPVSIKRVMMQQEYEPFVLDGKQIEVKLCKPKDLSIEENSSEQSMLLVDELTKDLAEYSILGPLYESSTFSEEPVLSPAYSNRYDNFSFSYDLNYGLEAMMRRNYSN